MRYAALCVVVLFLGCNGSDDPSDNATDARDGAAASDVGPDVGVDACATGYTAIELAYDSTGGFAGTGTLDCTLAAGELTVYDPNANPSTCTATLTSEQKNTLLTSANGVAWSALDASYRPKDNPYCCCDQFAFAFTATLTGCGSDQPVSTKWCQSNPDLPMDFSAFLTTLQTICRAVLKSC